MAKFTKRQKELRKLQAVAFAMVIVPVGGSTLGGCGTINGIGRDVAGASRWMQEKLDNGFDANGENRRNYQPENNKKN